MVFFVCQSVCLINIFCHFNLLLIKVVRINNSVYILDLTGFFLVKVYYYAFELSFTVGGFGLGGA